MAAGQPKRRRIFIPGCLKLPVTRFPAAFAASPFVILMKEAVMKDSSSIVEADMSYAVRMVESHFATLEDAARTCGVDVSDLKERLSAKATQPSLARKKLFEEFDR